jgi:uncharacterized protein YjgD (DUF1641 family)
MREKNPAVVIAAATLGSAIAGLLSTSANAQAAMLAAISGEGEPPATNDMFLNLHQKLEPIENTARTLAEMIAKSADPISMDNVDISALGDKFKDSGTIVDMTAWDNAAALIEDKGFGAFLNELRTMNSNLDRVIYNAETKFTAWDKLDDTDRMAAITGSDDDSLTPAVAKLGTSVTQLHSFATVGMMMLHELTYQDDQIGDVEDQKVGAMTAEPAEA